MRTNYALIRKDVSKLTASTRNLAISLFKTFLKIFDRDFGKFDKQLDSIKLFSVIEKLIKLSCKFDTHLKFYFYFEKKNIKKLKNYKFNLKNFFFVFNY
jgi:hypothetical protein